MAGLRAYRMRWKRRRFLWRAWNARRALRCVADRTGLIQPGDVLVFACVRNEAERLPHFLDHYRNLGAAHFILVDNDSTDGTAVILEAAADVSLWTTGESYRASRFGMDWINYLLGKFGSGHWCLTVDADELLVFEDHGRADLREMTDDLDARGQAVFGAMMLDLYPDGALGAQAFDGGDPTAVLTGFDPTGYRAQVQPLMGNLWVQGGVRDRMFFRDAPERAPTLNKTPLVKWHWRYAYVSSTHSLLPRRLNDWRGQRNGVLLHTKFLPSIARRAQEEKVRGEHFGMPGQYAAYYDALMAGPTLWSEETATYAGWQSPASAGLFVVTDPDAPIYRGRVSSYSGEQRDEAGCLPDAAGHGHKTGRADTVSPGKVIGRD